MYLQVELSIANWSVSQGLQAVPVYNLWVTIILKDKLGPEMIAVLW